MRARYGAGQAQMSEGTNGAFTGAEAGSSVSQPKRKEKRHGGFSQLSLSSLPSRREGQGARAA